MGCIRGILRSWSSKGWGFFTALRKTVEVHGRLCPFWEKGAESVVDSLKVDDKNSNAIVLLVEYRAHMNDVLITKNNKAQPLHWRCARSFSTKFLLFQPTTKFSISYILTLFRETLLHITHSFIKWGAFPRSGRIKLLSALPLKLLSSTKPLFILTTNLHIADWTEPTRNRWQWTCPHQIVVSALPRIWALLQTRTTLMMYYSCN